MFQNSKLKLFYDHTLFPRPIPSPLVHFPHLGTIFCSFWFILLEFLIAKQSYQHVPHAHTYTHTPI